MIGARQIAVMGGRSSKQHSSMRQQYLVIVLWYVTKALRAADRLMRRSPELETRSARYSPNYIPYPNLINSPINPR